MAKRKARKTKARPSKQLEGYKKQISSLRSQLKSLKMKIKKGRPTSKITSKWSDLDNKVNSTDLINYIASRGGMSRLDAKRAFRAFVDSIMKGVSENKKITISGFGSFHNIKRKERCGRNPMTGEQITIPSTNYPKFRPGREFKTIVNTK